LPLQITKTKITMKRHKTIPVKIGNIIIGGDAPIVVQTMTDTPTANVSQTVEQIKLLHEAGAELVRLTVNTEEAAKAVPEIRRHLNEQQRFVPLIGDFHYNGHLLLTHYPECAKTLDKYRINPGNVGSKETKDDHFDAIIKIAIKYDKPVRIGANGGSIDQVLLEKLVFQNTHQKLGLSHEEMVEEALISSVVESAKRAEYLGLPANKIILSCKVSDASSLIRLYRKLSKRCHYALHLGLTESGSGTQGLVASSIAIGVLLEQGIGDTIRVSITPGLKENRTKEVIISQQILQALNLRHFMPQIISCPGCGRTCRKPFQQLVSEVQTYVQQKMPEWKHYKNISELKIAVMGCIVNGPGESKHANIGISLPGTTGNIAVVYADKKKIATLQKNIKEEFLKLLEQYVIKNYS